MKDRQGELSRHWARQIYDIAGGHGDVLHIQGRLSFDYGSLFCMQVLLKMIDKLYLTMYN